MPKLPAVVVAIPTIALHEWVAYTLLGTDKHIQNLMGRLVAILTACCLGHARERALTQEH